jgi:hypothetical protein
MTEFSKLKIAFSLALLGTVFAVSPLIKEYGVIAYKLFGLLLSVKLGFAFFALFLGSAVYFYAVALIGESVYFDAAKTAGNIAYTIALIIPPLYLLLYPVSLLADLSLYLLKSPWAAGSLQVFLGAIVAIAVQATVRVLFATFREKDRSERIAKLEEEGNAVLSRARKLFGEGYFDISVTESWKAIEIALRRAFYNQNIQVRVANGWSLVGLATEKELISAQQAKEISLIRKGVKFLIDLPAKNGSAIE